ncbi:MAG: MFS transporter [Anaerolineaceae bacterium]|nr:MFS transporter [Anaerolineaceae bacterium]
MRIVGLRELIQVRPARLRFQLLAFSFVLTILNTSHRMVYPFLPEMARSLGVSLDAINLAITLRFALGLFSPFLGALADRRGRKSAMLAGVAVFAGAMFLVGVWPTYPALVIALLCTGLGKILFGPAVQAYLGERVAYNRRGLAISLTELGWSWAFLFGIPAAGWVIARSAWNVPYLFLAGFSVGMLLVLWRILPDDRPLVGEHPSLINGLRVVITHPAALAGLTIAALMSMSSETISIVYGVWMEDAFALQIAALGSASAVIGIAELGGEGLVAAFTDRLGKRRALLLGLITYTLSSLLLPILSSTIQGALLGLFLFYITFEFSVVTSLPLLTEIMPDARATFMAATVTTISLGRMIGSQLGPALFSFGLPANATASAILTLVAIFLLWLFIKE